MFYALAINIACGSMNMHSDRQDSTLDFASSVDAVTPLPEGRQAGLSEAPNNRVDADRPTAHVEKLPLWFNAAPATPYRFLDAAVEPDEIGRLGNYRVLRLLGEGGMAYVFLAEDILLERRVALKVMRPDLDDDPSAGQRFLREARALASIKHDHLVAVYQVGAEGRVVYLAMELLEGQSLEAWVDRNGPAAWQDIVRLGREIATGLAAVHQKGLIHRDLKPSNLWLEEPGRRIKLLDFGLARPLDDNAKFTKSGYIVGTPAFMSPEQARGDRVDARSDLFSLGSVIYYLASKSLPFASETIMGTLTALAVDNPQPIGERNPSLPAALCDLIMGLLAKKIDDRPASAQAVADRLRTIEKQPVTALTKDRQKDSIPMVIPATAVARSKSGRPNRLVRFAKGVQRVIQWAPAAIHSVYRVLIRLFLIALVAYLLSGVHIQCGSGPMPQPGPGLDMGPISFIKP
jgi:serine/threonine protein kinase